MNFKYLHVLCHCKKNLKYLKSIIGTIPKSNNYLRLSRRPSTYLTARWIYYTIKLRLLISKTSSSANNTSTFSESISNSTYSNAYIRPKISPRSFIVSQIMKLQDLPDSRDNANIGPYNNPSQCLSAFQRQLLHLKTSIEI